MLSNCLVYNRVFFRSMIFLNSTINIVDLAKIPNKYLEIIINLSCIASLLKKAWLVRKL